MRILIQVTLSNLASCNRLQCLCCIVCSIACCEVEECILVNLITLHCLILISESRRVATCTIESLALQVVGTSRETYNLLLQIEVAVKELSSLNIVTCLEADITLLHGPASLIHGCEVVVNEYVRDINMIILRSQLSIVVDNILSNSLVQSLDSIRNISISYSTIVVSSISRSLGSREYSLSLIRGLINSLIVIVTYLSALYSCAQCLVSINRSLGCGDSISSSVDSLDRTIFLEFRNS